VSSPFLANDQLLAQNVPPKATQPGVVVQDSAPPPSSADHGNGGWLGMLPTLAIMALLIPIFLLTSRRQKKEEQARAALKKGDRVTTNAGIIGELLEMDDRYAKVKIAAGVNVQFLANTVLPLKEAEKSAAKDLKEAKPVTEKK
jgi:preprotein translocase subunit YajC